MCKQSARLMKNMLVLRANQNASGIPKPASSTNQRPPQDKARHTNRHQNKVPAPVIISYKSVFLH